MQRVESVRVERKRVRRMALLSCLVLSVVLSVVASSAAADPDTKAEAEQSGAACPAGTGEKTARLIQARYEGIRDIHANFEQTSQAATFAGQPLMTPEPKKGRVVFAKPG